MTSRVDSPTPDLTVVMVTHNGRDRALATLRSAKRVTGDVVVQSLVVDCGSTGGVADAIASA